MKPSTFGTFQLPPIQAGSLQIGAAYVDATMPADEEDGVASYMGTDPMPVDRGTIQATFMISRGWLHTQGYDLDEGGLDTALFDFAVSVIGAGNKTLTFVPSGGTTPKAGLGGANITSWTCHAQVVDSYVSERHVNGAQAYAELPITFLIGAGTWTVNTVSGSLPIPLV